MVSKVAGYCFSLICLCFCLAGCQPKVYLMPSPVGLEPGGEWFKLTQGNIDENLLYTLYATNRQRADKVNNNSKYNIFPSDNLKLGFTVHRVGDEGLSWEDIIEESIKTDRSKDLLISSEYARQVTLYNISDDLQETSPEADGYFDQVNSILDNSFDKDILVYVHGANSNFYRATAQGAQFYHFTGHNSVVLTFSWPSAENLLKYKTDVLHARQTVPAFARLIELLANHTKARQINIIAYSAGAQVIAPGLAYLVDKYPGVPKEELRKKLRIGEVYFAAPDTDFKPFIERYLKFKEIVGRTTINLNPNDSVLKLAAFQNKVSRLGRPDSSELNTDEFNIVLEAMGTPHLNVLDVGSSTPLNLGGAHDSWYSHPWVSMDALMLLLFNLDPIERGLELYMYKGVMKLYQFPANYDTNIFTIAEENRDLLEKKVRIEHGK